MSTNTQNVPTFVVADTEARAGRRTARGDIVLGAATITTGLLAGLYYGWAVSVMPGFQNAGDRTVVDGIQQMNIAIQNPAFFASFMGAPALATWAWLSERRRGSSTATRWLLAGAALNLAGLVVTFAFNIPLNDELDRAGDPATIANVAQVRDDFETPWVAWNIVRTVLTVGAFGALAKGVFSRGRRA